MKNKFLKTPILTIVRAFLITFLICAFVPSVVFASPAKYSVRFTASYVSGNTGGKNVYYILDDGSTQLLGTVSQNSSIDTSFDVTFSDTIRVYVQIGDNAIYNEHLYINNNLVSNGSVGNAGLTYTRNDSIPPSGKITSPISGKIITECPMLIAATVTDDNSGIDWVIYSVKYDGIWHQIATDNSSSSTGGYSTKWDCSLASDQTVDIRISARDNAGNQADILGGEVNITLARGQTNPGSVTTTPALVTMTTTSTESATQTSIQTLSTQPVASTSTSVPPSATITSAATLVSTPKNNPKKPLGITLCSSILLPIIAVGFAFLLWRYRP